MYYVNDGIYGSFNCIMFDHYTVVPALLKVKLANIFGSIIVNVVSSFSVCTINLST